MAATSLSDIFTSIANAIRSKRNQSSSTKYKPEDMAAGILAITSGNYYEVHGQQIIYSSINSSTYSADKAFDGSLATKWATSGSGDQNRYIGYRWTGYRVKVNRVVLYIASDPMVYDGIYSLYPTTVYIEYSDNGSSWTTAHSFTYDSELLADIKFDNNVSAYYWRVRYGGYTSNYGEVDPDPSGQGHEYNLVELSTLQFYSDTF